MFFALYLTVLPLSMGRVQRAFRGGLLVAEANMVYYFLTVTLVFLVSWAFLRHGLDLLLDWLPENLFTFGTRLVGARVFHLLVTLIPLPIQNPNPESYAQQFALSPAATVMILVVLMPLVKGPLFRGLLFGCARRCSRVLDYVLSTLVFIFYCVQRFVYSYGTVDFHYLLLFLQCVPMSLALTWCYDNNGSIWSPVALHMVLNAPVLASTVLGAQEDLSRRPRAATRVTPTLISPFQKAGASIPHILQLDPYVADLIVAGGVVERLASVVKELMENAINARADALTVEIRHSGMGLIRVTDNGYDIATAGVETAFLRRTASKLRTGYGLEAIGTLDFRRETLAAISTVSRIELLTRTTEEDLEAALSLEGGAVVHREGTGCPQGTTMVVRGLFYNTPARLGFLKKDTAEGAACFAMVQRVALSHPEVSVKFLQDGKQELLTPGDGQVQSALYAVLGRDIALGFTPVRGSGENMSVSGFVSLPTCYRGTRGYQHFFVNDRYVKSRTMMTVLEETHVNQKIVDKFPGYVLHLTTQLNAVDVNVHPTKQKIKFGNGKKVFNTVYCAIKSTLETDRTRPSLQVKPPHPAKGGRPTRTPLRPAGPAYREMTLEEFRRTTGRPAAPLPPRDFTAPRAIGTAPASPAGNGVSGASISIPQPAGAATHIRPAEAAPVPAGSDVSTPPASAAPYARTDDRARLVESTPASGAPISTVRPVGADAHIRSAEAAPAQPAGTASAPPSEEEPQHIAGEVLDTYIIVERGDKVSFIDKHAVREWLNFDRMKTEGYQPMVQALLELAVFTPSTEEGATLLAQFPLLGHFGFEAEDFGDGTLIVRVAPNDVAAEEIPGMFSELADRLLIDGSADPDTT